MNDFSSLLERLDARVPPLAPTQIADAELSREIRNADLFAGKRGEMVEACRAGLLMWNDDLGAAHPIVQAPESEINNFWHAILHRREADFSNARYWWRRVGYHPAMDEICDIVLHRVPDFPLMNELRASGKWEPLALTDLCEQSARTGAYDTELRAVQRLEMKLLLEWCASCVR